jgi:NADPH:quinone reductase-like Zn-dependent oxidoreductase
MFRFGSQKLGNFLVTTTHEDLNALKDLIEAGKVTPVLDHSYPLDETAKAIGHVGRGHTRGKVTVTMAHLATPATS